MTRDPGLRDGGSRHLVGDREIIDRVIRLGIVLPVVQEYPVEESLLERRPGLEGDPCEAAMVEDAWRLSAALRGSPQAVAGGRVDPLGSRCD
jgi:hypothetical protein